MPKLEEGNLWIPATLPQERDYAQYGGVDGVKLPLTVQRMEINARITVRFRAIQHNVAVDDSAFQAPAGET
jgi:hypothetical protein